MSEQEAALAKSCEALGLQSSFGSKWAKAAREQHVCRICQRKFETQAAAEAFAKRWEAQGCGPLSR